MEPHESEIFVGWKTQVRSIYRGEVMKSVAWAMLGAVLLLACAATAAEAQVGPDRAIRLGYTSGSVSIQPGGTGDWVGAAVNRPVNTGDNVWADKNSRAELSFGTGVLRINSETSLTIRNSNRGNVQVMLHLGTLNVRVFHFVNGEIDEVDTPTLAFTLQKPGEYRFDVGPSGDATVVTVWKGEGTATGDGPAVKVRSREQVRFTGSSLAHSSPKPPKQDGFDSWCQVRDTREEQHALFGPYPPPVIFGYPYPGPYRPWMWIGPWGWVR